MAKVRSDLILDWRESVICIAKILEEFEVLETQIKLSKIRCFANTL